MYAAQNAVSLYVRSTPMSVVPLAFELALAELGAELLLALGAVLEPLELQAARRVRAAATAATGMQCLRMRVVMEPPGGPVLG
jgi:hypothetical protein